MTRGLRRSFSSLEVPNYRRYFAGQIVSLSGNWMQTVAEMWLILSSPAAASRSASPRRCSSCRCSSSAPGAG